MTEHANAEALMEQGKAQGHHHVGHVVPFKVLTMTFGALIVLTVITVAVAQVDLGKLNIWVALAVALVKASIVVLFFMHMKWDRPLNALILISSMLFVILFIGLALTDTKEYQPQISTYRGDHPEKVTFTPGTAAATPAGSVSEGESTTEIPAAEVPAAGH